MNQILDFYEKASSELLEEYEAKFKALADRKRLQIMFELCQRGKVCVCDLTEILDIPQSSLSYHLKILTDAQIIQRETHGTWSYYTLNNDEIGSILAEPLCAMFRNRA